MIVKPASVHLTALANLSAQPIWRYVDDLLEQDLAATHERLETATGADVGQLQGRAKWIREFMAMLHKPALTM